MNPEETPVSSKRRSNLMLAEVTLKFELPSSCVAADGRFQNGAADDS